MLQRASRQSSCMATLVDYDLAVNDNIINTLAELLGVIPGGRGIDCVVIENYYVGFHVVSKSSPIVQTK